MKKRILFVMLLLLLLCGCEEQPEQPIITESVVWEEAPRLNHGVLEYEKLTVQPWYCGRLEFSSQFTWAETELGYYFFDVGDQKLYYADKVNLSNWVPVCGKPDCKHTRTNLRCDAQIAGNCILIRDGRIFYEDSSGGKNEPTYIPDRHGVPIICSRALNGTDLRVEYSLAEVDMSNGGGLSSLLTPEHWLVNTSIFNTDGTYTHRCYRITDTGVETLAEMTTEGDLDLIQHYGIIKGIFVNGIMVAHLYGDRIILNELVSKINAEPFSTQYRYQNGRMEKVDITGCELAAKYLSGNTLRLCRADGYYDLDLTTREETFLAPGHLENAVTAVLLPNCIVETNENQIAVFDGEVWQDVEVPEGLYAKGLSVRGVASDRIFFTRTQRDQAGTGIYLYQVLLDRETLELEYCGPIVEDFEEAD